ncbi:MAG TPA: RidA family protein [Candidatus Baltobacteraceae bacterium]|nr:RidA family protein [Candidatus Baltobacteraceae bacterium]
MADIVRLKPGPRYSAGVLYGGLLFTAGQVDAQAHDVAGQTRNVLAKLDALLAEAGTTRSRILSANIWLADIASFDAMNAVWDAWIDPSNPPARATVESKLAAPEYLVEVSLVAALD